MYRRLLALGLAVLIVAGGAGGPPLDVRAPVNPLASEETTDQEDANADGERYAGSNRTGEADPEPAPTDHNATANESADDGDAGNDTDEDEPRLGNLSMEGADRERVNDSTIVFTWEDELPAANERLASANTSLGKQAAIEVPTTTAYTVEAELALESPAALATQLDAPDTTFLCQDAGEEQASCGVSALAREEPTNWSVHVTRCPQQQAPTGGDPCVHDGGPRTPEAAAEPVAFTATLTVQANPEAPDVPTLVPEAGNDTVDPGWPNLDEATFRPGVTLGERDVQGLPICTGNFVFSTPDDRTLYVGTAAHCVRGLDLGDPVGIADGQIQAGLAHCSHAALLDLLTCPTTRPSDPGYWDDFALLEIPDQARDEGHPALRVWGGPTGIAEPPSVGSQIYPYANSPVRDAGEDANVGDSRTGVVLQQNEDSTMAHFGMPPTGGDSGSPVIDAEGDAVGTIVTLHVVPPGAVGISNLALSMANLEETTGRQVEIATWPTFDPPRAEDGTQVP
ncbi:hypothetical protein BRD56_07490 [Thermoplasmatales archaeon SW_10_69_26]|nr:MAG: hypothetical protein BRD56_07490 [Thermoplasmatales archaeon SW_10_69_26]